MSMVALGRRAVPSLLVLCTVLWGGVPCVAAATDGGEKDDPLQRARVLARTDWNWQDRRQQFSLRVFDRRGRERTREMVMLTQRDAPGKEKTLAVFLAPAEVRGTAFLQHVLGKEESTQWLYLPDLGRSRRIHGGARKQSFVGTDFSYADLDLIENVLHWKDTDASVRRVEASPFTSGGGGPTYEFRPHGSSDPYERILLELSAEDLVVRSLRMYVAGEDSPRKILKFRMIRETQEIPTAFQLEMVQPQRGTRTVVDVSGVRYDTGLQDRTFTKRALEQGLDHAE